MWTRLARCGAAALLALGINFVVTLDRARAVICNNVGDPTGSSTANADDGGSPNSTACGFQADAGGTGTIANTVYGGNSNASGTIAPMW